MSDLKKKPFDDMNDAAETTEASVLPEKEEIKEEKTNTQSESTGADSEEDLDGLLDEALSILHNIKSDFPEVSSEDPTVESDAANIDDARSEEEPPIDSEMSDDASANLEGSVESIPDMSLPDDEETMPQEDDEPDASDSEDDDPQFDVPEEEPGQIGNDTDVAQSKDDELPDFLKNVIITANNIEAEAKQNGMTEPPAAEEPDPAPTADASTESADEISKDTNDAKDMPAEDGDAKADEPITDDEQKEETPVTAETEGQTADTAKIPAIPAETSEEHSDDKAEANEDTDDTNDDYDEEDEDDDEEPDDKKGTKTRVILCLIIGIILGILICCFLVYKGIADKQDADLEKTQSQYDTLYEKMDLTVDQTPLEYGAEAIDAIDLIIYATDGTSEITAADVTDVTNPNNSPLKNVKGDLSVSASPETIDVTSVGDHSIVYTLSSKDEDGNIVEKSFSVTYQVRDTQMPVIELASTSLNLNVGDTFEPKAVVSMVNDPVDGALSFEDYDMGDMNYGYYYCTSDMGLTSGSTITTAGNYSIVVHAQDKNGNKVEKTVAVVVGGESINSDASNTVAQQAEATATPSATAEAAATPTATVTPEATATPTPSASASTTEQTTYTPTIQAKATATPAPVGEAGGYTKYASEADLVAAARAAMQESGKSSFDVVWNGADQVSHYVLY